MSVKVNGNFLTERANGSIPIPFNSEYSLKFRNKNNRRAVVKFYLDGENVSGSGYVIPANSSIEIERHADNPNKFKFVSLDSGDAIDFGKNGPNKNKEKGVIVAHFYLEKEVPKEIHHYHNQTTYIPAPYPVYPRRYGLDSGYVGSSMLRGQSMGTSYNTEDSFDSEETYGIKSMNCVAPAGATPVSYSASRGPASAGGDMSPLSKSKSYGEVDDSDSGSFRCLAFASAPTSGVINTSNVTDSELKDGCTVEGSSSSQRFGTSYVNTEESYTEVRAFLQGYDPEVTVVEVEHVHVQPTPIKRKVTTGRDLSSENAELQKQLKLMEENAALKARIKELQGV